jgi:FkbM family methyltransferase
MIKSVGFVHRVRAFGRSILPQGRFRTLANSLLLAIERRKGTDFDIAGTRLRFMPGSEPHESKANASAHVRLDTAQLTQFAESVHSGDVVADVGGYHGVYSAVAAARTGDTGHVLIFEPIAANIASIKKNLALNHVSERVTIVPRAVSSHTGSVTFYADGASSANSMFRDAIEPHAGKPVVALTVETTTLDEEFARFGRMPRIVKIDVEGAEFDVLRGAEQIVRSDAIIFCELHPHAWREAGYTGNELRDWLRERGREIVALESDDVVTDWTYGPVRLVQMRS